MALNLLDLRVVICRELKKTGILLHIVIFLFYLFRQVTKHSYHHRHCNDGDENLNCSLEISQSILIFSKRL
jgi:hypothetical protein